MFGTTLVEILAILSRHLFGFVFYVVAGSDKDDVDVHVLFLVVVSLFHISFCLGWLLVAVSDDVVDSVVVDVLDFAFHIVMTKMMMMMMTKSHDDDFRIPWIGPKQLLMIA